LDKIQVTKRLHRVTNRPPDTCRDHLGPPAEPAAQRLAVQIARTRAGHQKKGEFDVNSKTKLA
jgi:hypothetical protein